MTLRIFNVSIGLLALFIVNFSRAQIITYPAQNEEFSAKSDKFFVTLYKSRTDTKGFVSYVYTSNGANKPSKGLKSSHIGQTFNFSIFSFSDSVTVEVTKINSTARSASLKPMALGLGTFKTLDNARGKTIRFTLKHPSKVSVEFDDDPNLKDAIMIFANASESNADIPSTNTANVFVVNEKDDISHIPANKTTVYFPPGVFEIGYWQIPIYIKQVYISGGAFVRGYLFASRNSTAPLKINGRGVLSNDIYPFHNPEKDDNNMIHSIGWYKMIQISGGKNHRIDGITLVDGSAFYILVGADSSIVNNVNLQGFRYNNDGITKGGNYLTINNCFLYLDEDAIILSANSIQVHNTLFWQLENGSLLQLGWRPHKIGGENIVDSCIIMHAAWTSTTENGGFINAMNAMASNDTLKGVENFKISNIYVEEPVNKFVEIDMAGANKQPNWFRNFSFDNIHFNSYANNAVINLSDHDEKNKIYNFTFKNIYINGKKKDPYFLTSRAFLNKK